MSGTPDTEDRDGPTAAAPGHPTLEPDERLWLESYLERLKEAPGGFLQRLVVYGSKAPGATPDRRAMSTSWCSSETSRTP